jgi:hypothetical protein
MYEQRRGHYYPHLNRSLSARLSVRRITGQRNRALVEYHPIPMTEPIAYYRVGESPLMRDVSYLATVRLGLGLLLITTFLSGACIASCFLIALDFPLGIAIVSVPLLAVSVCTAVFLNRAPTLTEPILNPRQMRRLIFFDVLGASGLVILAVGACVLQILLRPTPQIDPLSYPLPNTDRVESFGFGGAALAFTLFTAAVPRFRIFYSMFLAPVMVAIKARKTAQHAAVLGWLKLVSDGGLVGCVGATGWLYFLYQEMALYPAVGALLGLGLYGAVWIYTWVVHIAAYRQAGRALTEARRAGDVVKAEAVT